MATPRSLDLPNSCALDGEGATIRANEDFQLVVEACEHVGFDWVRVKYVRYNQRSGIWIPRNKETGFRERLALANLRTIARNGDPLVPRENYCAWVLCRCHRPK